MKYSNACVSCKYFEFSYCLVNRVELDISFIVKENNNCEKYDHRLSALDIITEWISQADGEALESFKVFEALFLHQDIKQRDFDNAMRFYNRCKKNEIIDHAIAMAINMP